MPKLWTATIDAHRREVREAIVDATAALVGDHGLAAVTMAGIAEHTGIGRATLYKYFSDVETILVAWHERHVAHHLEALAAVRERYADPRERLEAVLEGYAEIVRGRAQGHGADERHVAHHAAAKRPTDHHGGTSHAHEPHASEIAALVHRSERVAAVQERLVVFMRGVLEPAAKAGVVRRDVPPEELARYCLEALAAARDLTSRAAVRRLVSVTLAGLRPAGR